MIGPRGAGTWLAVGLQAAAVAAWAVGWSLWLPLAVALLVVGLVRRTARRRLGGLTGDLLGAVNQVAHISVMAAVVAVERTST